MTDFINDFLNGGKILLESSEDFLSEIFKKSPSTLVISYSSNRKRDEIIQAAAKAGLSVGHIKEPHFYLSSKKLDKKLETGNFSNEETPFLLKMAFWRSQTQTGDREEITLEREQYGMFDILADNEGKDVFYKKNIESAENCDILLIHHYALAREINFDKKPRNLIITEAAKLEESFTQALSKKYTLGRLMPYFGEKTTLLIGLLGIFYERFVPIDQGGFRGNVILNNELRQTIEWQRMLGAIENLPENAKKTELRQMFSPQKNAVQWITSYADELAFLYAPILLGEYFRKSIEPFKGVLLQSDALSVDGNFDFVKEMFELDTEWKGNKKPAFSETTSLHAYGDITNRQKTGISNLDIKIPEKFPEPFSEGYFKKCISLFMEIIAAKKGKALFILSSKKAVDAVYKTLLPKVQQHNVKLLAIGPSGGVGKGVALFLENPQNSVLLATNQIISCLQEIEDQIEVFVFQKIPFDPPSDPLLSARSSQFKNGFEQYTLPRAIMRFRELLAELGKGKSKTAKTCYILDSRLLARDYGRFFL